MKQAKEHLAQFAAEASDWFKRVTFVQEYYNFFKHFFKRENLEKVVWSEIQQVRKHLHCFQSMPLVGAKALGKPNHSLEQYRNSLFDLAHGPGTPADRIRRFANDPAHRLKGFGEAAISELVGYLFPDDYVFKNARDEFAVEFLGIKVKPVDGNDLVSKLEAFSNATRPVAEMYLSIVGNQTDLPLNLELDQFFSWLYEKFSPEKTGSLLRSRKYWTLSAGSGGEQWPDFQERGIAAIGWDGTPDLRTLATKADVRKKLQKLWPGDSTKKNDTHACWQFVHDINVGDIIFAKKGLTKLLGYGVVEGAYEFDPTRPNYRHVRKVNWKGKGEWDMPETEKMSLKTLTDITPFPDFIKIIASKVGLDLGMESMSPVIDDTNISIASAVEAFDKKKAMKGLFLDEAQFDEMLTALKEKKNVVLQGAPGVGKTYVAKRLAYAFVGSNDPRHIETIQFHQSYSYEDFIQGYRPTAKGQFALKQGIFYQFCRRAQRDEDKGTPYVFIIDEINRGNLSKIFGELMMLIEPDKRGKEFAIPLSYSEDTDEKFYIPENLHVIGMMNTADRSLAMVDYALRRRFRFVNLRPGFSHDGFAQCLAQAGAASALIKKVVGRMNSLNHVIAADAKNLGSGYEIGHSFFCPGKGTNPNDAWFERVVRSEIMPLIQEYWFDDDQKVSQHRAALLA